MRRAKQALMVAVLAGFLSGCGGARPTKYYVLDVPSTPSNPSATQYPISLIIARPVTSHLYRDDRIVYGAGTVELGTYEFHRWAQTPADMVQDLLVTSLRVTNEYRSVLRPGTYAKGEYIVRSYLTSLYEVDKPQLVSRFALRLEIFDPKTGTTVWTGSYSHDEPVTGGKKKNVSDVVEAMAVNVRAGMQQLVTGVGQYFAAHPPQAATQ